ncbi:hypothetical protein ES708_08997 [subsurface metagenome]
MITTTKSLEIGLRPCQTSDISTVMQINETTLPENYPLFFYEQILERYPEAFTLAYLKENPDIIVGYIMWRVERGPSAFGLEYVKKGHLVSLAVLKEYRRQGVAHGLLNKSMEMILQYGVDEYVLEVRVSNTGALNLYANFHQFETIKIVSHYYRDGEDAFYMCHKHDERGRYVFGSTGMNKDDINNHYRDKKRGYLCYRCPNCSRLMIKGLYYSLPGSISPNDTTELHCADCGTTMKYYDISQSKYDVKN